MHEEAIKFNDSGQGKQFIQFTISWKPREERVSNLEKKRRNEPRAKFS